MVSLERLAKRLENCRNMEGNSISIGLIRYRYPVLQVLLESCHCYRQVDSSVVTLLSMNAKEHFYW